MSSSVSDYIPERDFFSKIEKFRVYINVQMLLPFSGNLYLAQIASMRCHDLLCFGKLSLKATIVIPHKTIMDKQERHLKPERLEPPRFQCLFSG